MMKRILLPGLCAVSLALCATVRADNGLLTSNKNYSPAKLSPKEPTPLEINYPGQARKEGIGKGSAFVSVLVDPDGRARDVIAVEYTAKYFGDALAEEAKTLRYEPAKLNGVAVPARYNLQYKFESGMAALTPDQEVARMIADKREGTEKPAYQPAQEADLDHPLEPVDLAVPRVPRGYENPDNHPVEAVLTFFVDEQGHVHAPNVEIADSPKLITGAVNAVMQSTFKPPTVKGHPVLVLVQRTIKFAPRKPAANETTGSPAK